MTIRVTGHQWWWEIRYESQDSSNTFTTANEIHVPVGQPVNIKLNSTDVIHSFWVPSLTGKLDAIPGRENQLRFTAEPGGVRVLADRRALAHLLDDILLHAELRRVEDLDLQPALGALVDALRPVLEAAMEGLVRAEHMVQPQREGLLLRIDRGGAEQRGGKCRAIATDR
ncbi:hypothetical protein JNW90_29810 [Micromonospora sp. STR1s_5]|nr:hypothetical protein [Micromonospora sp. STR1s_5]